MKAIDIANRLAHSNFVILDELGCLPFRASGGALLFIGKACSTNTSVVSTTNLSFIE